MRAYSRGRVRSPRGGCRVRRAGVVTAAAAAIMLAAPVPASAQGGSEPELEGLFIAGFRGEPDSSAVGSGFDLFVARLGVRGEVPPGIGYHVQVRRSPGDQRIELLDVRLRAPLPPGLQLSLGQFKSPFSREALQGRGEISLLDRSQAVDALSPGRQVGAAISGEYLGERLWFAAGAFNGEGRNTDNPDGDFLWAGRVRYRNVERLQYHRGLILQLGASAAFSSDSGRDLRRAGRLELPGVSTAEFSGDRLLLGADLQLAYRDAFASAEYVRARLEPRPVTDDGPGPELPEETAEGWYVEGGYSVFGVMDLLARYDAFRPLGGERRSFVVLGANLEPVPEARLGVQGALQAEGPALPPGFAPAGATDAGAGDEGDVTPGSRVPGGLADGQVIVRLQINL